jgi:hypothetical protein
MWRTIHRAAPAFRLASEISRKTEMKSRPARFKSCATPLLLGRPSETNSACPHAYAWRFDQLTNRDCKGADGLY